MQRDTAIVFDCGATNIRVIAIDAAGSILASEAFPNATRPDPYYPAYRIWDTAEIWEKMCLASRKVMGLIEPERIAGVTVTTFGVDGTLFSRDGRMLYPVISWQCERTKQIMSGIGKYIPQDLLYGETGVLPFSFNTIYKMIWFLENRPEIISGSHMFLFMPSIFIRQLTGEMVNDTTMAGTSMMMNQQDRDFSDMILGKAGISRELMGPLAEPGAIVGTVTRKAFEETSIPAGTPVVATGHDTQFAIFGSGAGKDEPVLSSGTWEILMVRAGSFRAGPEQLNMGITTELDARPGLFNIGTQWIASGVIEWVRRNLFSDLGDDAFDLMIEGAEKVADGSNGVKVIPRFYEEREGRPGGQILGLTMDSTRDEIFRAVLESLSLRLAEGRTSLENAGGFRAENILCVGGGSRNRLWNRLRAKSAGVPLRIIKQKETTVLGASLFVQAACGNFRSPEDARSEIDYNTEVIEPG